MGVMMDQAGAGELGYVPPRVVSFGWIGEAFTLFGARPGVWILAILAAFGLPFLVLLLLDFILGDPMGMFSSSSSAPTSAGQWVLFAGIELVIFVLSSFFYGALCRMAIQQVRGVPITARDIWRGGRVFGPMTGFTLLVLLAVLGLEILCFAPALGAMYFSARRLALTAGAHAAVSSSAALTVFAAVGWVMLGLVLFLVCLFVLAGLLLPGFALVADGRRVWTSLRDSVRAMRGQWLSAAALMFVMGLLILVSEIPVLLGLFVTMPMLVLLSALAYRDMVGMPGIVLAAPPSYDPPQPGVWPPPPTPGPSPSPTWGPPPAGQPPR